MKINLCLSFISMGNAQERRFPTSAPLYIKSAVADGSTVVASLTPGAPTTGDITAPTVVQYVPVPVLRKEETLLTRVLLKLVPPEGEGWKLYEKSYGDVYNRDPSKMYWARDLCNADFKN